MAKKKVFLDPGHGGTDSGASAYGLVEKHMNLVTAKETRAILEASGVDVKMSRTTDVYPSLSARADAANKWGADYFVSIHYNAGGGDGAECIHSVINGKSKSIAQNIVNAIESELKQNTRPREVYSRAGSGGRDYHAVIRETAMPATIVEGAFIDSNDRKLVDSIGEQKAMGRAIAKGILKELGMSVKRPASSYKPVSNNTATYKVVKGDTLSHIAVDFGTTVAKIKSLNGLKSDLIKVGQVLKVPAATHKVVRGNTLSGIAARYGTSVGKLKAINGLKSDLIKVGQVLKVR
jgi:LysM repeat protein